MLPLRCLLLGLGLLAAGGCARRPGAAALPPPAANPAATVAAAGPRLLFFSGRLAAAAGKPSQLAVLQLQAVPGAGKLPPADAPGPDYLLLTQLAADGHPLAQTRLPHPLRYEAEAVAGDQRGFERSRRNLPEAEFTTRLALQPGAAALRVAEQLDQQTAQLADLPLPAAP